MGCWWSESWQTERERKRMARLNQLSAISYPSAHFRSPVCLNKQRDVGMTRNRYTTNMAARRGERVAELKSCRWLSLVARLAWFITRQHSVVSHPFRRPLFNKKYQPFSSFFPFFFCWKVVRSRRPSYFLSELNSVPVSRHNSSR